MYFVHCTSWDTSRHDLYTMTYQLIPWWIISYFYTLYIPRGLFLEMTYFVKYVDKKNWKKDDFAFFTKKQPKSLQFCQSNQPIIFQTYLLIKYLIKFWLVWQVWQSLMRLNWQSTNLGTGSSCLMRISLLRISLLRFFKTITKIWLMRFYGLFILLLRT